MKRLTPLALIAAMALALPAQAEIGGDIVAQLRAQGFSQITVTHTLLGRVRILAKAGRLAREIVLNPNTGEILRDYTDAGDSDTARTAASASASASGGGLVASTGSGAGGIGGIGTDTGATATGADAGTGTGGDAGSGAGSGSE